MKYSELRLKRLLLKAQLIGKLQDDFITESNKDGIVRTDIMWGNNPYRMLSWWSGYDYGRYKRNMSLDKDHPKVLNDRKENYHMIGRTQYLGKSDK